MKSIHITTSPSNYSGFVDLDINLRKRDISERLCALGMYYCLDLNKLNSIICTKAVSKFSIKESKLRKRFASDCNDISKKFGNFLCIKYASQFKRSLFCDILMDTDIEFVIKLGVKEGIEIKEGRGMYCKKRIPLEHIVKGLVKEPRKKLIPDSDSEFTEFSKQPMNIILMSTNNIIEHKKFFRLFNKSQELDLTPIEVPNVVPIKIGQLPRDCSEIYEKNKSYIETASLKPCSKVYSEYSHIFKLVDEKMLGEIEKCYNDCKDKNVITGDLPDSVLNIMDVIIHFGFDTFKSDLQCYKERNIFTNVKKDTLIAMIEEKKKEYELRDKLKLEKDEIDFKIMTRNALITALPTQTKALKISNDKLFKKREWLKIKSVKRFNRTMQNDSVHYDKPVFKIHNPFQPLIDDTPEMLSDDEKVGDEEDGFFSFFEDDLVSDIPTKKRHKNTDPDIEDYKFALTVVDTTNVSEIFTNINQLIMDKATIAADSKMSGYCKIPKLAGKNYISLIAKLHNLIKNDRYKRNVDKDIHNVRGCSIKFAAGNLHRLMKSKTYSLLNINSERKNSLMNS